MATQLLSLLFLCFLSFPQCSLPPILLPPPSDRQTRWPSVAPAVHPDVESLWISPYVAHCLADKELPWDAQYELLSEIIKSLREHDYLNSKPCCTDRLACLLIEKTGINNESSRVWVYKIHVWLCFYSNMRTLFILSLIEIFDWNSTTVILFI